MKKGYFEVLIKDENNDAGLIVMCEAVCKTVNCHKVGTYIFRDLITQKMIFPNYGSTEDSNGLSYDNYDKDSYREVSPRKILNYLKGLGMEQIDMYSRFVCDIENKSINKNLVRKIDN